MPTIIQRLIDLNIHIPDLPKPVAAYIPAQITGNLIYASGQTPTVDGKLQFTGRLGEDLTVGQGYEAARLACLNCLAEIQSVLGTLDRIQRIVKVNGYVRSAEGFGDQPKVINGASELLLALFGEAGKHARAAIGVSELPFGAPVEVEIIAEFADFE
jgi:enamine deaminase RidA (YjgF/YER057c/UK114 family)